jgi:two-component system chemotaxis response regulator CheY
MDLILSDWRMAPVGGLELLASLREDPKLKSIPFVMLTAESTKERVVSAIRSGVDDYIVKPLSVDLVQTKVMGVLLRKQVI